MKKVSIPLLLLAIAGSLYFLSFRWAHLRQMTSGDDRKTHLVVLGIELPYTPEVAKIFYYFYAPLLKYHASTLPKEEFSGMIRDIDSSKSRIIISNRDGSSISLLIPASMTASLQSFSEGDTVQAVYRLQPTPRHPFCFFYHLSALAHSSD